MSLRVVARPGRPVVAHLRAPAPSAPARLCGVPPRGRPVAGRGLPGDAREDPPRHRGADGERVHPQRRGRDRRGWGGSRRRKGRGRRGENVVRAAARIDGRRRLGVVVRRRGSFIGRRRRRRRSARAALPRAGGRDARGHRVLGRRGHPKAHVVRAERRGVDGHHQRHAVPTPRRGGAPPQGVRCGGVRPPGRLRAVRGRAG